MSYVILDLEWNGSYSKSERRFVNEIIEFGAVKTDDELNITGTFSALITPKIGKKLSGRVKQLTKITNEELIEGGSDFLSVTRDFAEFLGDSVLMTWGTSDIHALIDNYRYYFDDHHIPFLTAYCDIQEYCERAMGRYDEGSQMGLGVCAGLIGVEFSEEEQHRATADAELSLKCVGKFFAGCDIKPFILKADCEEFYERLMFKNYYITDLKNPEVDRKLLRFRCDVCGKPAKRVKKWKLHNRSFTAEFCCKSCGRRFTGRISFKKKYDGIKVNKRIIDNSAKEKTEAENTAAAENASQ